jgi:hypothetical protein
LAADRRRRLVAQQERFATTLWDAKAAERAAAKKGAEEDREDRRAALTGQRVRLLNELSTTPGSLVEKFNRIQIEFHSKPESAKDFFRKHFYLEGLDPDGPDPEAAWKSALQEVSKSSLHLLISEYIETGVVRWLTHPFTETLDTEFAVETIRTECARRYDIQRSATTLFRFRDGGRELHWHNHRCQDDTEDIAVRSSESRRRRPVMLVPDLQSRHHRTNEKLQAEAGGDRRFTLAYFAGCRCTLCHDAGVCG